MRESQMTRPSRQRAVELAKMLFVVLGLAGLVAAVPVSATGMDFSATIPDALKGPFVSDVPTIMAPDCGSQPGKCDGPLNFIRLIKAKASAAKDKETFDNPFKLTMMRDMLEIIDKEAVKRLKIANLEEDGPERLNIAFLNDPGSRVELVGVVNRMDRQFINDSGSTLTDAQRRCGEISLIYRFSYSIKIGTQKSRLPITMNIVLPALPSDTKDGAITCQEVAKRWVSLMNSTQQDVQARIQSLTDPATGALALINGKDIDRLQLNMQIYRMPGSSAIDFGTRAEYLRASAVIYSLMLTCRACGVDPLTWLRHALTELPQRQEAADIGDLLPFNVSKASAA